MTEKTSKELIKELALLLKNSYDAMSKACQNMEEAERHINKESSYSILRNAMSEIEKWINKK